MTPLYGALVMWKFLRDESGATAVEYAVVAALFALAVVWGMNLLGRAISTKFSNQAHTIQTSGS